MKTYTITETIEVDTYTGEETSVTETIMAGDTFDEDNILSQDEHRYEVQWGNGDVSFIPVKYVKQ